MSVEMLSVVQNLNPQSVPCLGSQLAASSASARAFLQWESGPLRRRRQGQIAKQQPKNTRMTESLVWGKLKCLALSISFHSFHQPLGVSDLTNRNKNLQDKTKSLSGSATMNPVP